jgi:SSS family transporter
MLAISWYCAARNKNTNDYFRASERIPWWAAGISIYATMLSSLTFMAVPATAFASNWAYFLNYASILLLAPVITHFYLPFFRRLDVTTAYEYLERRFNLFVRLFGSASFIAFQVGRTGIVLYLPALALSTVSNLDMTWCIVGMTLLSIALTVYGGMEAVIWTDVAQTVILLGAVIASLLVILMRVDGGLPALLTVGHEHGKFFESVGWSPSLTLATGWVALLGMGFNNLISYTSNQEVVQRYLTTHDEQQASRAVWTNALLSLPSGLLFFAVGTGLFVFYRQLPQRLDPALQHDAIFPLFILHELPAGVAGFVVAGIFAAAQPTSGLNSTAAAVVTDFYRRLCAGVTDRQALIAGRLTTVVTGLLGMSVALVAVSLKIESIWQTFLNVLGLTTGALAGLFALGIFTRRANGTGATLGLLMGVACVFVVSMATPIHPLLYGAVGVCSTFLLGYVSSIPFRSKPVEGLTIFTIRR